MLEWEDPWKFPWLRLLGGEDGSEGCYGAVSCPVVVGRAAVEDGTRACRSRCTFGVDDMAACGKRGRSDRGRGYGAIRTAVTLGAPVLLFSMAAKHAG